MINALCINQKTTFKFKLITIFSKILDNKFYMSINSSWLWKACQLATEDKLLRLNFDSL